MSGPEAVAWFGTLLGFLQWAQHGVLVLLHTLGLIGEAYGQPVWSWNVRIAGEIPLIDLGQAQQLGLTLAALMLALVAIVVAMLVRR